MKIGNRAKYEICDLFSADKELIQIKRYENGTSSISHLFTQAKFYAEAFLVDQKLRQSIREFIDNDVNLETSVNYNKDKDVFLNIVPDERPNESEYTVVLCILSTKPIELYSLPFMTLYSIFQTHKYLTVNFNYKFKLVNRIIIKGNS